MKRLGIAFLLAPLFWAASLHAEDAATTTADPKAQPQVAGESKPEEKKDYVILKVNGDDIKKSEVEETWKAIFPGGNAPAIDTFDDKIRDNVLRGVASDHILIKEAEKSGIQNSDMVKARVQAATQQIIIQEFLKQKTRPQLSDDALKAVYAERLKEAGGKGEEEVHARHILVKTEQEAQDIENKLKNGASFEKLAKEKSRDRASGSAGGDLGWFTADKMVPEFSRVAFSMKKGDISAPVKTDFGWHIIQVTDTRDAAPPSFEDMKEKLRQEEGTAAINNFITDVMKDVKITEYDSEGHPKDLPITPQITSPKTNL